MTSWCKRRHHPYLNVITLVATAHKWLHEVTVAVGTTREVIQYQWLHLAIYDFPMRTRRMSADKLTSPSELWRWSCNYDITVSTDVNYDVNVSSDITTQAMMSRPQTEGQIPDILYLIHHTISDTSYNTRYITQYQIHLQYQTHHTIPDTSYNTW